ncbi:MAG: fructose PTS transporter subunit IIA [Spirochaetales bacterium]|uniref:Fructose PTS transporter subunit IIA n=1 Tax=Candidatus Thalassospirochaeta sargassi TaxID=3119039 RepID=A0AAJ1IE31_9SPIO|nr:fructose PTS transporter subunit IIA [Spirochaetales bacterium]
MKKHLKKILTLLIFMILMASPLFAEGSGEESLTERMTELVFEIGIILFAAKLGGTVMKKIKMPSVLGELLMGIVIGPYVLGSIAIPGFAHGLFPLAEGFSVSPELYGIATIASIILLFLSGLETDLALFLQFSVKGAVIGITGVIISFVSGAWAGSLITGMTITSPVNLFMGVLSIATSVGITARILSEQRKMDSPEGVTILAAAVIDDVLGIIILAIVLGIISVLSGGAGGSVDWGAIGAIALKAVGVWLGFTAVGLFFARKIGNTLKIFHSETTIAVMSLGLALLLSGIFEKAGLAMIIGAYVMGLSLSRTDLSFVIQDKLHPIEEFFVPVFFCVMGMLVNVNEFLDPKVLMGGLLFSVLGIIAKIVGCGAPSLFLNFNIRGALRIGVGMVPRGEVALIIAGIGIANGILSDSLFGVAVFMTLLTTLLPPPLLTALLKNGKMGTRTEMKGSDTVSTNFDFPSREMTQMALAKVVGSLRGEGFYVHELDVGDHSVSQVRKEDVFLTFHEYAKNIEIVSDPVDVHYVKTIVYESLLGMNDTINRLKDLAKPEVLKEGLKELSGDEKARVNEDYFKNLNENCIAVNLKANTKEEVIEEMLGMLNKAGQLDDYDECLRAVKEREASMSTGMQNGIAIPHGKSEGVKQLVSAIGLKKDGLDFQSLDGKPSNIFIMTLSPANTAGPHIQFLSSVSTILNKKGITDKLLNCRTSNDVKNLLIREAHENR